MPKIRNLVHPSDVDKPLKPELGTYLKIYSDNLYDETFGWGDLAVRESWSDGLIQKIVAAGISNRLGIGLEYALKKYAVPNFSPKFRRDERLDEAIERSTAHFDFIIHEIYSFPKGNDSPTGEFFSGMSILKGLTTLKAAHGLAQQGYLLEPLTVTRSALEVIAWSRACHDVEESDKEYLDVTTSHAITLTRTTLPSLQRLYGVLSKFVHWHPDVHLAFMTSRDGVGVISRSLDYKVSTLIAVTSGYLLLGLVFLNLMSRYWPDRDVTACLEAAEELAKDAANLRARIGSETRMETLVADLNTCMEMVRRNYMKAYENG